MKSQKGILIMINKSYKKEFKNIKEEIDKAKNILFLTHRAPDGDAIGSVLALNLYLKKQKKNTYIYILGAPRFLNFLPYFEEIKTKSPKHQDFDLIFSLDYAGEERLEKPFHFFLDKRKIISIDHHPEGKIIGKIKLILPFASSTSEILYYLLDSIKAKIDKNIATCLLAGILTDTGGFSFASQNSERVVGKLLKEGAELSKIMERYNSFSLSRARILAKMISRIKRDEDFEMLWSWLSFDDFKREKERSFLQEPPIFPDFLSRIDKAKVYLFMIEYKNGRVKGSLRSRQGVDVSKISQSLGGGGHKSASGFKTTGTIKEVLEKVKRELKKELK